MRRLISAFKVSLDMKFQGPGDYADWVPAWSEDYDLGESIDACLLGLGKSSIGELSADDIVVPPDFFLTLGDK